MSLFLGRLLNSSGLYSKGPFVTRRQDRYLFNTGVSDSSFPHPEVVANKFRIISSTAFFVLGTLSFSKCAVSLFAITAGVSELTSIGGFVLNRNKLKTVFYNNDSLVNTTGTSASPILQIWFGAGPFSFKLYR